ncbi:rCG46734, isoform CRA_b, partial [Rattus norvegicus]
MRRKDQIRLRGKYLGSPRHVGCSCSRDSRRKSTYTVPLNGYSWMCALHSYAVKHELRQSAYTLL